MNELVSVVMSTYNESLLVLEKSIDSILNQTYKNIQLVLINDNPNRNDLNEYLDIKVKNNSNIKYIVNDINKGLVFSLNEGIKNSDGEFIARMDADDISHLERIEKQMNFLKTNKLDLVGSYVKKIDENNRIIGEINVPYKHVNIVRYHKYGNCLLHPTWFGKRTVFEKLNGYRNIYSCEDYDFITRAIHNGYKLGNVREPLLDYRIRSDGISVSSEAKQKLLMYYISKHRNSINDITEVNINDYIKSEEYHHSLYNINRYIKIKNEIKKEHSYYKALLLIPNKYFYINFLANIKMIERKIIT